MTLTAPSHTTPRRRPVLSQAKRATVRWPVSPNTRKLMLVVHVLSAVGLTGHLVAATGIGIAVAANPGLDATGSDASLLAWYTEALTPMIGGSLSVLALVSGIGLGLASRWGVFRYGWVISKLVLLVATVVLGMASAGVPLITGGQWVALAVATVLSVYKPRRRHAVSNGAA